MTAAGTPVRRTRSGATGSATTSPEVLLGVGGAGEFLARYWQREALLVRNAVPNFTGMLSMRDLFALAARDDVESRLVQRTGQRWTVTHGPLRPKLLRALPDRHWTLLVQGVNLHVPAADALMRAFRFIPYARLDDLMVSYAVPGGGVGPHLDLYDVFLLQGDGRRRWRYGPPQDRAFRPGLPLCILRRFTPAYTEVLGPGDMLYLPPEMAHDGVALDACTTYSIGFRAPSATELGQAFLQFLQDHLDLTGRYADAGLAPAREPARIDEAMRARVHAMLAGIRWDEGTVARFLGAMLSEPKAHVFFEAPRPALPLRSFLQAVKRAGLQIDARTQLLYDTEHFYVNGSVLPRTRWPAREQVIVERLANDRTLPGFVVPADAPLARTLYDWYRDGFLHARTT